MAGDSSELPYSALIMLTSDIVPTWRKSVANNPEAFKEAYGRLIVSRCGLNEWMCVEGLFVGVGFWLCGVAMAKCDSLISLQSRAYR